MGWTCRRPGCHREAAASIGYDAVACQVWLDPLGVGRNGQHLCEDHAERLHAPRGWVVVDRRGRQSSIVARPAPVAAGASAVPAASAGAAGTAPRVPRRWGQLREPRLEFSAQPSSTPAVVAEPPPEVVAEPEEDPPAAATAPPPDLGELLTPTSPLLSRAFADGGPQRSALLGDAGERGRS